MRTKRRLQKETLIDDLLVSIKIEMRVPAISKEFFGDLDLFAGRFESVGGTDLARRLPIENRYSI